MKRCVGHHNAANRDRLQPCDRRQRAGASDLDVDVDEFGNRLLCREFMRRRPARRARAETEPRLKVQPVDLVDHAVDIIIEIAALNADFSIMVQKRINR